jgi:uncharacterized protein (TIGR02118 family)
LADDQEHLAADPQGGVVARGIRQALARGARAAHAVPGLRRYVQSHIVGERTRSDIPSTNVEVDGIAETWYDDLAAMERANASSEAKALHADGALFIGRIKSFITEEKVIIPRQ